MAYYGFQFWASGHHWATLISMLMEEQTSLAVRRLCYHVRFEGLEQHVLLYSELSF